MILPLLHVSFSFTPFTSPLPVQSSAADIAKLAMIKIYRQLQSDEFRGQATLIHMVWGGGAGGGPARGKRKGEEEGGRGRGKRKGEDCWAPR